MTSDTFLESPDEDLKRMLEECAEPPPIIEVEYHKGLTYQKKSDSNKKKPPKDVSFLRFYLYFCRVLL